MRIETLGAVVDFQDTEIAFRHYSDQALYRAYALFRAMGAQALVNLGSKALGFALDKHLPVKWIIRQTLFRHFCGGESLAECQEFAKVLEDFRVGAIADYSVEGKEAEASFDETAREIGRTIESAAHSQVKPAYAVFKLSGLGRIKLLNKINIVDEISDTERAEYERVCTRVRDLCRLAAKLDVRLMIDAEDFSFQNAADAIALTMMREFNQSSAVVYNTVQMYRWDRSEYLRNLWTIANEEGFLVGLKIVRGAYMEKERARAAAGGYCDPIHPTKEATDHSFDEALAFVLERVDRIWILAGTHNEASTKYLAELMDQRSLAKGDHRIAFSQLLGMSDNLTYNLASAGYQVRKYVPYGPIEDVFPYLVRRAQENTAIHGQTSRELGLLIKEIARRRQGRSLARESV
jgi:proline dehydrogenase